MFTLYPEYDDGDDDDNYSVAAGRANCSLVGTAGVALSRVEGGPADLESLLIRGENLTLQLSMSTDVEGLPAVQRNLEDVLSTLRSKLVNIADVSSLNERLQGALRMLEVENADQDEQIRELSRKYNVVLEKCGEWAGQVQERDYRIVELQRRNRVELGRVLQQVATARASRDKALREKAEMKKQAEMQRAQLYQVDEQIGSYPSGTSYESSIFIADDSDEEIQEIPLVRMPK